MICTCTVGADAFVSTNTRNPYPQNRACNFLFPQRKLLFLYGRPILVYIPLRKKIPHSIKESPPGISERDSTRKSPMFPNCANFNVHRGTAIFFVSSPSEFLFPHQAFRLPIFFAFPLYKFLLFIWVLNRKSFNWPIRSALFTSLPLPKFPFDFNFSLPPQFNFTWFLRKFENRPKSSRILFVSCDIKIAFFVIRLDSLLPF